MTDRHAGYVVVLEKAIRDDDAEATIAAIKQIKGVLDVRPIVDDPGIMTAQIKAEHAFRQKLIETFFTPKG